MSRKLKTKYPCRICGEPAEVESRRASDDAICEPCARRHVARCHISWAQEAAYREFNAVNEKTESATELLRGVFLACSEMAHSAALTLASLPMERSQARRRIVGGARARAEWVLRKLRECEAFYGDAMAEQPAHVVSLVSDEDAPLVLGGGSPPALRLLPGGK